MQRMDTAGDLRSADQRRTMRLAWTILIGFFALTLGLVLWGTISLRSFYLSATIARDGLLVRRGQAEWISWKPVNRSIFQGAAEEQPLGEGDAVRIASSAGYGQVASITLFDESQLDLWAGADVRLETLRTSRWSGQLQAVRIQQNDGYVRYDVSGAPPFPNRSFVVGVRSAQVILAPGGSYSIDLRQPERQVLLLSAGQDPPLVADVAVRSGSATVIGSDGRVTELRARERVEIDPTGLAGPSVPARWELISDGGFSLFSEQAYNNTTLQESATLPRSDTWQVYSGPELPPGQGGYFRLSQICRPPDVDNYCLPSDRRTAAWLYRTGGQTNSFTVGVEQRLGPRGNGLDISEYRSLTFSVWVRVLYQSLEDTGDRGTECPVMIRFYARQASPADPDFERVLCVYTNSDGQPPLVRADGIDYVEVPLAEWVQIPIDLRRDNWLADYRYISRVQIFAQGHDYDARVADVSLVGEQ